MLRILDFGGRDGLIQSGCNLEGRGRDILHRAPVRALDTVGAGAGS